MSILSPAICIFGRHSPQRRNVQWDGLSYVGHCKHCGKEIKRIAHRNWKERQPEVL